MKKDELELTWLVDKVEKTTERYIEAEQFILNLKWYHLFFTQRKITKFLKSRNKYNFLIL